MEVTDTTFEIQYQSLQKENWYWCQTFKTFDEAMTCLTTEPAYLKSKEHGWKFRIVEVVNLQSIVFIE